MPLGDVIGAAGAGGGVHPRNVGCSLLPSPTSVLERVGTLSSPAEWRVLRIRCSLPLVSTLLAADLDRLLTGYLDAVTEPSNSHLTEAERFVAHCRAAGPTPPHFDAVSRFELITLRQAASMVLTPFGPLVRPAPFGVELRPSGTAEVIRFDAPPDMVIGALARGALPPAGDRAYFLLCALRVCRPATTAEATTWRRLNDGCRRAECDEDAIAGLWAAGALAVVDDGPEDRPRRRRTDRWR